MLNKGLVLCGLLSALLAGLALPESCVAGVLQGVIHTSQQVESGGSTFLLINTTGLQSPQPVCHAGGPNRMAIDMSTEHGRGMAVLAVASAVAGKSVQVDGTGTCIAPFTNIERAQSIYMLTP